MIQSTENARKGIDLGASPETARFLASLPPALYRVRYGYVNEASLGDMSDSRTTEPVSDYGEAMDAYKALAWLRTRDAKGRRFVVIERSSDGGATWSTRLFHDCQHF